MTLEEAENRELKQGNPLISTHQGIQLLLKNPALVRIQLSQCGHRHFKRWQSYCTAERVQGRVEASNNLRLARVRALALAGCHSPFTFTRIHAVEDQAVAKLNGPGAGVEQRAEISRQTGQKGLGIGFVRLGERARCV